MKNAIQISRKHWLYVYSTFIALVLLNNNSIAQDYQTDDTVLVQEIVISGESISRFQSGAKIEKIPTKQFEMVQDGNLEQLLSRSTPISFKGFAGGLSTIRVRGTSPDHTSINFGGININSLTLGHSNISNIPLYLFDEIGIQYGSSTSVNGSGNIGGAIHLGLNNSWTKGFKAEMRAAHGSFGEQLYGTKLFLGNGKFESVTRVYYYYLKNSFKFFNTSIKDFETGQIGVDDKQQNATIENKGIIQELNYKFATNEYFSLKIWIEDNDHLIQQNMSTNYITPNKKEYLADDHIRIWSSYKNRKNALKYSISAGYVYDNSVHNENTAEPIKTQRIIGEGYIEHDILKKISYKLGAKGYQIKPEVHAYSESLKNENRIDAFASLHYQLSNKVKATLNIRQGFVTDFKVPFTPSFGINYLAVSKETYILSFNGNVARSYNVPTFNDRYWISGGNPTLNPEQGMNYEIGSKYSFCNKDNWGSIKLNAFYMNVDQWILWTPFDENVPPEVLRDSGATNFWYAQNVQNVISKGFELMFDYSYNLSTIKSNSGINLALTSTIRKESIKDKAIGRQLEYVPLLTGNFFTNHTYKKITLSIDGNYTHKQYTNEEDDIILDPYFLLNISTSYHFHLNPNNTIKINGLINNVLNASYQSTYGYAMPGINYRISLTYNFK